MDEAEFNRKVEERVQAILAQRETNAAEQAAVQMRVSEDKQRKDQALMRLAASAGDERRAEAAFRSPEGFNRASSLASAAAVRAEAELMVSEDEEWWRQVNGGR